jgi:hypothetical protein
LFYGVSKVPTFVSAVKQKNINALQGRWFFFTGSPRWDQRSYSRFFQQRNPARALVFLRRFPASGSTKLLPFIFAEDVTTARALVFLRSGFPRAGINEVTPVSSNKETLQGRWFFFSGFPNGINEVNPHSSNDHYPKFLFFNQFFVSLTERHSLG